MHQHILGIVYSGNQVLALQALISKQKMSYFGHIKRLEGDRLEKAKMIRMSEGKWKRGRPHMRWTDEIRDRTKTTHEMDG